MYTKSLAWMSLCMIHYQIIEPPQQVSTSDPDSGFWVQPTVYETSKAIVGIGCQKESSFSLMYIQTGRDAVREYENI